MKRLVLLIIAISVISGETRAYAADPFTTLVGGVAVEHIFTYGVTSASEAAMLASTPVTVVTPAVPLAATGTVSVSTPVSAVVSGAGSVGTAVVAATAGAYTLLAAEGVIVTTMVFDYGHSITSYYTANREAERLNEQLAIDQARQSELITRDYINAGGSPYGGGSYFDYLNPFDWSPFNLW